MDTTQRLQHLHELFVARLNAAVGDDRSELVADLQAEYLESALAVILDRQDRPLAA